MQDSISLDQAESLTATYLNPVVNTNKYTEGITMQQWVQQSPQLFDMTIALTEDDQISCLEPSIEHCSTVMLRHLDIKENV
jgi:hypothetical protein